MAGRPSNKGEDGKKEEKRDTRAKNKNAIEPGQQTLDSKLKKVAFTEKEKEFRESIQEEVRIIRQEAVAMEKMKAEMKERQVDLIERIEKLEKRMKEMEEREKEREEHWREEVESRLDERSRDGTLGHVASPFGSSRSLVSAGSVESGQTGISGISRLSRFSFSDRDVRQMKRMLAEKERNDNREVIAIRGLDTDVRKEAVNVTVVNFLKDRLGVDVEIGNNNVKIKGKVIVIRFKSVEEKEKVMRNKNKLAGSKVFIEHYRSFDERKRQEEIGAWVREMKEKGYQFKIGFGKIFYKDTWVRWEDRENLLARIESEEKRKCDQRDRTESSKKKDENGEKKNVNEGLHFW